VLLLWRTGLPIENGGGGSGCEIQVTRWSISTPKFAVLVYFERPWYGNILKWFIGCRKYYIDIFLFSFCKDLKR
jgi:hypothetical protein